MNTLNAINLKQFLQFKNGKYIGSFPEQELIFFKLTHSIDYYLNVKDTALLLMSELIKLKLPNLLDSFHFVATNILATKDNSVNKIIGFIAFCCLVAEIHPNELDLIIENFFKVYFQREMNTFIRQKYITFDKMVENYYNKLYIQY